MTDLSYKITSIGYFRQFTEGLKWLLEFSKSDWFRNTEKREQMQNF